MFIDTIRRKIFFVEIAYKYFLPLCFINYRSSLVASHIISFVTFSRNAKSYSNSLTRRLESIIENPFYSGLVISFI